MKETVPLEKEKFSKFKNIEKRIKLLKQPYEKSPGMSRQRCIDEAKGEYIYFIDSDDEFEGRLSLSSLINISLNSKLDFIDMPLWQEVTLAGEKRYIIEHNIHMCTGKLYKVSFLRSNNIRFTDKLNLKDEDLYFEVLVRAYLKKEKENYLFLNNSSPVYLWKENKESLTRKTASDSYNYYLETRDSNIYAYRLAFKELEKRNIPRRFFINEFIEILMTSYKQSTKKYFENGKHKETFERVEKATFEFYNEFFKEMFNEESEEYKFFFKKMKEIAPEKVEKLSNFLKNMKQKYIETKN